LVSHVAVRARNAGVLFATCFEPEEFARLKGLRDKTLSLRATPGGDVEYEEAEAPAGAGDRAGKESRRPAPRGPGQAFAGSAVTPDRFTPEVVGGKSNNLNGLRGKRPDWIRLPAC